MLKYAVIFINLAFVFYTIGVWSEKKQGILKFWHVAIFCIGLLFDTLGTTFMGRISGSMFSVSFHGITGLSALLLMIFHVLWAIVVLFKNNTNMKSEFHRFSIVVWVIWLIPFLSGAIMGMIG
jgi:uncharacterized repeat protein (TIGR03987 family)